ncbi:MAG: hypothetical protein GXO10_07625 [Crenarchaeota archaeon]|nr:hypothetical protein [Thermoproteota archaeon]
MPLYSLINQIIHLAESRGEKDIVALALDLEREITKILAKLIDLKMIIDEVLDENVGKIEVQLTKVESDILDVLREQPNRCLDVSSLTHRLSAYTPITLITALKRLKSLRLVDIDVDVDSTGKLRVKACIRVR